MAVCIGAKINWIYSKIKIAKKKSNNVFYKKMKLPKID